MDQVIADADCVGFVFGDFGLVPLFDEKLHRTLFICSGFTLYAATMTPSVGGADFVGDALFVASQHQYTLETSESLEYSDTHFLTAALFLELNALNANVVGFPTAYHRKQPSTHHYEAIYFVGARGCKCSKLDQFVIVVNGITSYFTCLVKCENAFYTLGLGQNLIIDFDGPLCLTRGALAATT